MSKITAGVIAKDDRGFLGVLLVTQDKRVPRVLLVSRSQRVRGQGGPGGQERDRVAESQDSCSCGSGAGGEGQRTSGQDQNYPLGAGDFLCVGLVEDVGKETIREVIFFFMILYPF